MDLSKKRILFVGDSSGLNEAIINQIQQLGGELFIFDDIDFNNIEIKVKKILEIVDAFDGIVFAIVKSDFKPLQFVKPEVVDSIMHLNYGLFIELIRILKKLKGISNGASIVALSSISSIKGMKAKMAFCSSKAALDAAIRCLAIELGDRYIRLNSIQKGGVDTDMEKGYIQNITVLNDNATERKQILGLTKAVEIANTVAFLLSDATKTITGTSIIIDGGYTL